MALKTFTQAVALLAVTVASPASAFAPIPKVRSVLFFFDRHINRRRKMMDSSLVIAQLLLLCMLFLEEEENLDTRNGSRNESDFGHCITVMLN